MPEEGLRRVEDRWEPSFEWDALQPQSLKDEPNLYSTAIGTSTP
jgi:hypothetical protein